MKDKIIKLSKEITLKKGHEYFIGVNENGVCVAEVVGYKTYKNIKFPKLRDMTL